MINNESSEKTPETKITGEDISLKDKQITDLSFKGKPIAVDGKAALFYFGEYDKHEILLLIEKDLKYNFQWVCNSKKISRKHSDHTGLHIHKTMRDNKITNDLINKIKVPEDNIKSFLDELGIYLEEHEDQIFNTDKEEQQDEHVYTCFDDYPEDIKKTAADICKSDNPLGAFKNGISIIHEGDDPEIELSVLQHFTNRVLNGEPVHGRVGGGTDAGKSDLVLNCLKIVPERFQQEIQTLSSKSLYYDTELRDDYNHIIINDFLDSPDSIALIKVMTDNLNKKKTHRTVLDTKDGKKGVILEITGKNIVVITAAKDINDAEANRRFLHQNPKEDKKHKKNVKNFIKKVGITGIGDTDLIFEILQATYDKLTENEFNVFNPWIDCMNLEDKGFTDIKMFINLVKARTIIFQEHRHKIDEDTILGSKEDVIEVTKLWNAIAPMQQYKFSRKQVELLSLLDEYTKIEGTDGQLYYPDGKTYNEVAEALDVKRNTVYSWINGYYNENTQSGKKGLAELGFVITKSSDPDNENSPKHIYLNPEKKEFIESLKQGFDLDNLIEIDLNIEFNVDNPKNMIIKLYLEFVNYKTGSYKTIKNDPRIQKLKRSVKTDEEVYNIVKNVKEVLNDLPIVEIQDSVTTIFNRLTYNDPQQAPKQDKTPLIDDYKIKCGVDLGLNIDNKNKKAKEELTDKISEKILNATYTILKLNLTGINKHIFRDKLMEELNEDNGDIILDYEKELIDGGYIQFDGSRTFIKLTDKLMSIFNDKGEFQG